jgi:lipopolysaccharide/colanic/teichoic acid biosynthesis glycosyltransferase
VIVLLEWTLYALMCKFVYRKIPFFYEEPGTEGLGGSKKAYAKEGKGEGCGDADVGKLRAAVKSGQGPKEVLKSIQDNRDSFSRCTIMVDTADPETILSYGKSDPCLIVLLRPLNRVMHINTLFSYANYCLDDGGCVWCHFTTWAEKKRRILRENPFFIRYIVYFFEYCWHRIAPNLKVTRNLYFGITKGKRRALYNVSVMGRLYRAGFQIVEKSVADGEMYICASKFRDPVRDDRPSTGRLIRLKRIGKDGREIGVYKFRTMYPYSEYLQPCIYKQNGLNAEGRFADDWRITREGKFMRKTFIDELPMIANWFRGDMKLVGVRPLSKHYFGLYPKELQNLRIRTKPGLIPPFYADIPKTMEEKEASEIRYLKSYFEHPFMTDCKYFWKATANIIFKKVRSE